VCRWISLGQTGTAGLFSPGCQILFTLVYSTVLCIFPLLCTFFFLLIRATAVFPAYLLMSLLTNRSVPPPALPTTSLHRLLLPTSSPYTPYPTQGGGSGSGVILRTGILLEDLPTGHTIVLTTRTPNLHGNSIVIPAQVL